MPSIQFLSTTMVETWAGTDIATLGPIYPMVGSEVILLIIGLVFWLGFHFSQTGIENQEIRDAEDAAKDPDRLRQIIATEAEHF
ncbi:MAG: hypothetical protein ACTSVG_12115 [Alphaproteobacteria bacterium]